MMTERPPRLSYVFTNIRGEKDTVFECPCCRLPTIAEPGGFEICGICNWEDDDGFGFGPNNCSLEDAQANFKAHKHMYPLGHAMTAKQRRDEFLDTCIALLNDFKQQQDPKSRGILFAAFVVESEWL